MSGSNLYSREVSMGSAHLPVATFTYVWYRRGRQCEEDETVDLALILRWHDAVRIEASFAILF